MSCELNENSSSLHPLNHWEDQKIKSQNHQLKPVVVCLSVLLFFYIHTFPLKHLSHRKKKSQTFVFISVIFTFFPVSFIMVQSTDLEGRVTLAWNKIAVLWEARRRQNKMKISFHSSFRNVHPVLSEGIKHQSQKLWVIPAPWSPKQRRRQISCQLCHPTYPCVPLFYLLMGHNSTWKAVVLLLNDIMIMKTVSQINHLYPGCFFLLL